MLTVGLTRRNLSLRKSSILIMTLNPSRHLERREGPVLFGFGREQVGEQVKETLEVLPVAGEQWRTCQTHLGRAGRVGRAEQGWAGDGMCKCCQCGNVGKVSEDAFGVKNACTAAQREFEHKVGGDQWIGSGQSFFGGGLARLGKDWGVLGKD